MKRKALELLIPLSKALSTMRKFQLFVGKGNTKKLVKLIWRCV